MNFKTTIILVAVVVVVGAIWLWYPAGREAGTEPAATTPPVTDEFVFEPQPDREKIVRVELERADQPRLVFERVAGADVTPGQEPWRVVEPVAAPAEAYAVRGLVGTVIGLQSRATFKAGASGEPTAAEAGLEPPVATVRVTDDTGEVLALEIGKPVVMSTDTYVRLAGSDEIHVAKRDLTPDIRKELKEFRAKRLLDFKPNDATWVQIKQGGTTYTFSRGEKNDWVMEEPVRAPAVAEKVRGLVSRFSGLRADDFIDAASGPAATYGLSEPYLTFAVTTRTKHPLPSTQPAEPETQPAEPQFETIAETYRLVVGDFADLKSEKRFVQPEGAGWVATVAESALSGLVPNLKELRDPKVTRVKAGDITSVEVATADATTRIKKDDGKWIGADEPAALDAAAVTDLLDAIEDLEAIDYVEKPEAAATYGLEPPRATITVTTAGAVAPLTLRIGQETASGRNRYVQRGDEATVMVTLSDHAKRLMIGPLALRAREIFRFPAEWLQRIHIERPALTYELERDGGSWKLTQPAEAPVDRGNVQVLANDLSQLRARNVAGQGDDAAFGLDQPATTTTIRFEVAEPLPTTGPDDAASQPTVPATKTVTHTLRVGRKDNVSYARKDDEPYVFELDETVFRVLTAELIDGRLFTFKPDDVVGIKVVSTGGTLEFAKSGKDWKYVADPFLQLTQKKVQDFAKELSEMRAEAYFAYRGGDLAAEKLDQPPASATIRLADGSEVVLHMTQEWPGELPRKVAIVDSGCIFRMRQADCERLLRGLDEYTKPEPSPAGAVRPPAP